MPLQAAVATPHLVQLRARSFLPEVGVTGPLRQRFNEVAKADSLGVKDDFVKPQETTTLHFIAQLGALPTPERWEKLAAQGIHRAAFLHGRTFIVGLQVAAGESDARLDEVQEALGALALVPFEPQDRAAPALLDEQFSPDATVAGTTRVRLAVLFFPETPDATVEGVSASAHRGPGPVEVLSTHLRGIETDAAGLATLVLQDAVYHVEERHPPQTLLSRVRVSTGAEEVQKPDTSVSPPVLVGLTGRGVRISLGLEDPDNEHDDIWNHDAAGNRTSHRFDSSCISNWNQDGHATHVFGIAMGNGFQSNGRLRGMAPEATGVCFENRPDVSNHSYTRGNGRYGFGQVQHDTEMHDPTNAFHHLQVVAVGNNGWGGFNEVGYYSVVNAEKNALTVANIDSVDSRWGGSSLGPTFDGRFKPDLSAPGSLSRFPDQSEVGFELDYVTVSGGAAPSLTWDFNTPGNSEGWAATNNWVWQDCIGPLTWPSSSGVTSLAFPLKRDCRAHIGTTTDSTGAPLAFLTNSAHTVMLRYRFEATPLWTGETGRFWWATNPDIGTTYESTDFPIEPDGLWHTVSIPVGNLANWSQQTQPIRLLRISPVAFSARGIISMKLHNTYGADGGSSMASPAVTGAAALVLEELMSRYDINPTLQGLPSPFWQPAPGNGAPMPSTLKALLVHSAKDLAAIPRFGDRINPDTQATTVYHQGPDLVTGYGALDVPEAVRVAQGGHFHEHQLSAGLGHQYTLNVEGGPGNLPRPLKVTLAWDDAAGSPLTASFVPNLVNDLDLVLEDPQGGLHYPWTLRQPYEPNASNSPDQPGNEPITSADILPALQTEPDHRNNLEQVYVENPLPGTWVVHISPFTLPAGPQRYSVVLGTPSRPATHLSGGKLAWVSDRVTPEQIFVRDNRPGAPVQQFTFGTESGRDPVWSPNGDYLAFVQAQSLPGGGTRDALLVATPDGTLVASWLGLLGTQYTTRPSWSRDGMHLAFSYYDTFGCQGLALLDFTQPYGFSTGTSRILIPASCGGLGPDDPEFSANGQTLYFYGTNGHPTAAGGLFQLPVAGGTPQPVYGNGMPVRRAGPVSVSPDGQHILYNSELWREDPSRYLDEEVLSVGLSTGVVTQVTREPGRQYAWFAIGGDGEQVLESSDLPGVKKDLFMLEHGERVPFDVGDPGNAVNDSHPSWWKGP